MENLAKYIDQTLLSQDATEKELVSFCEEAMQYGFYSVCVQPYRVGLAKKVLKGSDVKIAAVVGFPSGATFTEIKVAEAQKCIELGADEIDMVMNIGALKDGDLVYFNQDIEKITSLPAVVKVIIETGLLTDEEKVLASKICAEAGADFVKTSTGFTKNSKSATIEDVKLMHDTVKSYGVKVKASGGVRDYETAIAMIQAGASRIGTSSGVTIINAGAKDISSSY